MVRIVLACHALQAEVGLSAAVEVCKILMMAMIRVAACPWEALSVERAHKVMPKALKQKGQAKGKVIAYVSLSNILDFHWRQNSPA